MGIKNDIENRYFSDNKRFAAVVNLWAEYPLIESDFLFPLERSYSVPTHTGRKQSDLYRERDVHKQYKTENYGIIIGIENQSEIHYGAPVRFQLYDALEYDRQLQELMKEHRRKKDLKGAEYINGISKNDRLLPVLTIVLYWGEKPWKSSMNLYEILTLETCPESVCPVLKKGITNYQLNILDVRRISDEAINQLDTDVKLVFGFVKYYKDVDRLTEFIEENLSDFQNLPEDAYDMIWLFSHNQKLKQWKEANKTQNGGYDMSNAIDSMIKRGKQEGRTEGIEIGISLINRLYLENRLSDMEMAMQNQDYRNQLIQEMNLLSE